MHSSSPQSITAQRCAALAPAHSPADTTRFYSKPRHLQFWTWNIWQDLLIRLNSAYSTSNSVRKISRNVYSFRSSCSCDSCYSAKPANELEVLTRTNRGNLDTEKLTETAATRRGCVTPTTLPSAVQPASARYCEQIVRVRN